MSLMEKLPNDAFKQMTFGAGIIMANFSPETATVQGTDILFATKGGLAFNATRDLQDMGADLDNCMEGAYQLQKAKPYQANVSGTAATVTPETIQRFLGNADVTTVGSAVKKITARNMLSFEDFKDLWVGVNYSEFNGEKNGGFCVIHLKHTLSMDGFGTKFAKDANGEFPFNFKAFYDLEKPDEVPFDVYIKAGTAEAGV